MLQCKQSASIWKDPVSNKSSFAIISSWEYIVQRFETPFLENPVQGKLPNPPVLNQGQSKLVKEELKEIMLKGAIQSVSPGKNQYLNNFLLVSKKGGGNRPVINLKHLKKFIPYQHFKIEGLNLLQNML